MFARRGWARWAISLLALLMAIVIGGAEPPTMAEEDPLPVESQWKGKLAQLGNHPTTSFPPEVDALLTVTGRDGDNIELELRESTAAMEITFQCRGRIVHRADMSLTLEVRSYRVKGCPNARSFIIDVPYTARLAGDSLKGSWKYVNKVEGIDLGGDFQLARAKDE